MLPRKLIELELALYRQGVPSGTPRREGGSKSDLVSHRAVRFPRVLGLLFATLHP